MAATVQIDGIHSTGMVASVSIAFDVDVTAGNAVLVGANSYYNNTIENGDITDGLGNTYTEQIEIRDGTHFESAAVYAALNITGGACTVTLDSGATSDWMNLGITEVSGLATSSAGDGSNSGDGNSTTAASGSVTPTTSGIAIAALGSNTSDSISTPSGFTLIYENEIPSYYPCSFAYAIYASGNQSATWTIPTGDWAACIACFKNAPAAAPLDQEGFRFRNDDGDEDAATWKEAQDTNLTAAKSVNTRLRVILDATGNPATTQYQLEYRRSGQLWRKVEAE